MVKNTIGGKNFKKGKKGGRKTKNPSTEFNTEDGLHFYGQVKSRIGGNTIDVVLQTGETVHATIPGRFIKKVWFNKDDLIVVRQEGNFYDVVQKITNISTMSEAATVLNIKLDKDNSNIFRADIDEMEEESENEEDEDKAELSKAALNAQRRLKDKERDLKRREGEVDSFDREISVVKKGESASDSDEDDEDGEDRSKNGSKKGSKKSGSTKSTQSTQSTSSTQSTQSETESDEEDIELSKPVVAKKKTVASTPVLKKKVIPVPPVTPEKQVTSTPTTAPDAPKKKVYRDTPEEIAKMMGL
jgi:translation initiation factor IF-1